MVSISRAAFQLLIIFMMWFCTGVIAGSVRDGTTGNCAGTFSCRPRCLGFSLNRKFIRSQCGSKQGVFARHRSKRNAWDVGETKILSCNDCIGNTTCQEIWEQKDLFLEIWEHGTLTSLMTTITMTYPGQRFTYCSINPCPKNECALPEQLRSQIEIQVFSSRQSDQEALAHFYLGLTPEFKGNNWDYVDDDRESTKNRIGPLLLEWMDDPTNCRPGVFSSLPPIFPVPEPVIAGMKTNGHPPVDLGGLFCTGVEYEPAPLPRVKPTPAPTQYEALQQTELVLRFGQVTSYLQPSEIERFDDISREFLQSRGLHISDFTLQRQVLQRAASLPRVNQIGDTNAWPIHDMASSGQKTILIVGVRVSTFVSESDKVDDVLNAEWRPYIFALGSHLDVFGEELRQQTSSVQPTQADIIWMVAALLSALLSMVVVLCVRRSSRAVGGRIHTQQDQSVSSPPRVHQTETGSTSTVQIAAQEGEPVNETEAVSVESESGWKSQNENEVSSCSSASCSSSNSDTSGSRDRVFVAQSGNSCASLKEVEDRSVKGALVYV